MKENFNLQNYLNQGVEKIVKGAIKATFSNPKESLFMAKFAISAKKATEKRSTAEKNGEHIPPFLIASITNRCNLHCAGCYARAIDSCNDCGTQELMSGEDWNKVFDESEELGISFIILAGGEPFVRPDVIRMAANHQSILFPIITNGTIINDNYIKLFSDNRNLVPIISVEGGRDTTDSRRGDGVFDKLNTTMSKLKDNGLIFGCSITVTTENYKEVMSDEFINAVYQKGCKTILYIEYVPATEGTEYLAPTDEHRKYMEDRLFEVREKIQDMLFVSFPGDENASSGCLAAGRGFFHINPNGGAEPCPFSPYSDVSVKEIGVREAMNSPLFKAIKAENLLAQEHTGGCLLFEKQKQVEAMLNQN